MAHSPTFVLAQPAAMRAASAIIVRHLLFARDRIRANDRSESGGSENERDNNYLRTPSGRD
jgi:hypothetical protein